MSDPKAQKAALRRRIRSSRRDRAGAPGFAAARVLEAQGILEAAGPILRRLPSGSSVCAFHPTSLEPDPLLLASALHDSGSEVLFPASPTPGTLDLDWTAWDGAGSFQASTSRGFGAEPSGVRRGVEAIAAARLILAPAMAVDRSGARLGHGGGYYDRAIRRARPDVLVIAVLHPDDVLAAGAIPVTDRDMPVHGVLTSSGLSVLRPHRHLGI